jgi:hypothetical protein
VGRAGARRIRFVESPWATAGPLEDVMLDAGWNVRALESAAAGVEFENTNGLGKSKAYSRFKVPGNPYMFPAYDLNRAYEDTDVFVSLAKLKNHATCGVTLSLKNCFGNAPASIYGDDAGVDEPNEKPTSGREAVLHHGKTPAVEIGAAGVAPRFESRPRIPRAAHCGGPGGRAPHTPGPHRRRRIHRGRRRAVDQGYPHRQAGRADGGSQPGVDRRGGGRRNGLQPARLRGTAPFRTCDNTLLLAEAHGIGTTDLKRIEVRGLPIEQALYRYDT